MQINVSRAISERTAPTSSEQGGRMRTLCQEKIVRYWKTNSRIFHRLSLSHFGQWSILDTVLVLQSSLRNTAQPHFMHDLSTGRLNLWCCTLRLLLARNAASRLSSSSARCGLSLVCFPLALCCCLLLLSLLECCLSGSSACLRSLIPSLFDDV